MPKVSSIRNNFNGGELSPKIDWRGDIDKYHTGCLSLIGFVPLVEGGLSRMPGTKYVVETKDSSKASRTVTFHFSNEQAYILEFGNLYIRFYKNNAQITSGGSPVEVASPYLEADLFELKFTQSADVLYIFHPDYAPRKLSRLSHTEWTLSTTVFKPPPTIEAGLTPATATLTPAATTGTNILFTASVSTFLTGDVGRVIEYGASRASIITYTSATQVRCDILDDFPDTNPIAAGEWTIAYSPIDELTPSATKRGEICTLTATAKDVFRSANVGDYVFINSGFIEITQVTSGTVAKGEILYELENTDPTTNWTIESEKWNSTDGYPAFGVFFEQRLCAGGTPTYPQSFDLSVSGDYENFSKDPDADDAAISYTLVSNEVEAINWAANSNSLILGTNGGFWRFRATSLDEPLTQINVSASKLSSMGTKNLAPLPINDTFVWADLSGRVLNRFDYSFQSDKYFPLNMTRIASHITFGATKAESGIVDMAFQKTPVPIVWVVRADGVLLGMTHETQENVYAWFMVKTDGAFESVAVISTGDEEDQVWCVVNRTINGSTVRNIEYFMPHELFGEIADSFFVHSGVTYDGGDAVTITGITNANPAVVSAVNTFSGGETIAVEDVEGMTEVNTGRLKAWTVANPTGANFELSGIDSTGWGTYESGGTAQAVKKDFTTGLDHLIGETVDILIDGAVHPQGTVSAAGELSNTWYGNKVHVGLPIENLIEPTKPFLDVGGGTSRGKKQRINSILLSFYQSCGCKIGRDEDNLETVKFGTGGQPELFTGEKELPFNGSWGTDAPVLIRQDLPLPLTLRAISYKLSVNDD